MKRYSNTITLSHNSRGIWDLDTVKGCKYGIALDSKGCYSACYAASIAYRYGIDFSNSTLRRFDSKQHERQIIDRIKKADLDFIRIGTMGDPSESWGHTIDICFKIKQPGKHIVIITKHWETIPQYLIPAFKKLKIIVNTSISALDTDEQINHRLEQYNRLKPVCKSVLRVVSCDFNLLNIQGLICNNIQNRLFKNQNVIDTVLRIPENHYLVKNGVVKLTSCNYISSKTTATLKNKNAFLGYCKDCPEMCGVSFLRN